MKREYVALLSILLILVVIFSACGGSATTATTTPKPAAPASTTAAPAAPAAPTAPATTTAAPAAPSAKPIEIIFAHTTPAQAANSVYLKSVTDEIEKQAGGRVKFTYYWSNSLMPQNELYKGIQTGVADMAYFPINLDFVPLSYFMFGLPFMGVPSMEVGTDLWWKLYDKTPAMQKEWNGIKIMAMRMMPGVQIHTTKKMVKTPADIKGMKIISTGGEVGKILGSVGAASVEVGVQDLYMSLSSGLTEGYVNHWPVVFVFGVLPLLPNHANIGEGGIFMNPDSIIMNPKSFDKLPADIQKIFVEQFKIYEAGMIKVDNGFTQKIYKDAKDLGHTTVYLTAEETQTWKNIAAPFHDSWLQGMEKKGYTDVRSIYNEAVKMISQTGK